jgi:hypothetical protein
LIEKGLSGEQGWFDYSAGDSRAAAHQRSTRIDGREAQIGKETVV